MTVLAAEGLHVRLGGADRVAGVTSAFGPGWTAVVGPNGAGKSTLLRALSGLLPPSEGRVTLDGADLVALTHAARARGIGWLAQGGDVTGELDVRGTVALGRIAHRGLLGAPGADDAAIVDAAVARCGCAAWSERALASLSGGERQRVLVARVLATEAPVLLLDEPTTHLDAPHQVALARLFAELAATRRTVVTVLHDLAVALAADRLVVMAQGQVVAAGGTRDAALHRALETVFDGAVRVTCGPDGRARAELAL